MTSSSDLPKLGFPELNPFSLGAALLAFALAGFGVYCIIILIRAVSDMAARPTEEITLSNRKVINSSNYSNLAQYEFYKLQGMSMNDVLRMRLLDISTATKAGQPMTDELARDIAFRKSLGDITIDEEGNILTEYDPANARGDIDWVYKGELGPVTAPAEAPPTGRPGAKR